MFKVWKNVLEINDINIFKIDCIDQISTDLNLKRKLVKLFKTLITHNVIS